MNINIFLHENNLELVVCLIVLRLVFILVRLWFSVEYRVYRFSILSLFNYS